jgi:methionyl-tRNA synthetase
MGGDRMSKSSGLMTDPTQLVDRYGPDPIRYYVCRESPFGQDIDYTEERLVQRYTGELCNGIGNLASRLEAMFVKYRDGLAGPCPADSEILSRARDAAAEFQKRFDVLDLKGGVEAAMGIVADANLHVDRTAPFRMAKDPDKADALQVVLAELAGSLLIATCLLYPVMPAKMGLLHERLCGRAIDPASVVQGAAAAEIPADWILSRGPSLFPRLEETAT